MGTMVGDDHAGNQVGVAPGATWIAAKGCETNCCTDLSLALSAQWMLAPTKLDGSDPDPARRPNIINNSWGSADSDDWYRDFVRQWVAAGIFPAFAAGNDGPGCGSVSAESSYSEAYAVGSVDETGQISSFSGARRRRARRQAQPHGAGSGDPFERARLPVRNQQRYVDGDAARQRNGRPALVGRALADR